MPFSFSATKAVLLLLQKPTNIQLKDQIQIRKKTNKYPIIQLNQTLPKNLLHYYKAPETGGFAFIFNPKVKRGISRFGAAKYRFGT